MGQKPTLKPLQERAIIELLRQPNKWTAAQAAGVPERTLYNWLNEPNFASALAAAQHRAAETAFAEIAGATQMAVDTLREVMRGRSATPAARVRAATQVLSLAAKNRNFQALPASTDNAAEPHASSQAALPAPED